MTPDDYVAQLATEPRTRGFSVYLAERMDPGWWAVYGQAIGAGRILVGEPPEPTPEERPSTPAPEDTTPTVPTPRKPKARRPTAAAARARMIELAKEMEAEWARQGRDPAVVARSRIVVARLVLETTDTTWESVRDELSTVLAPPEPPAPDPDT